MSDVTKYHYYPCCVEGIDHDCQYLLLFVKYGCLIGDV